MEMPCICKCGEMFDLYDGCRVRGSNELVCEDCGAIAEQREKLKDEIEELELQIDNGEIGKRDGKKKLKELRAKLASLD